ncbi:MAG: tRNA guanosine(34) transglycosylase Tgt [bacterium]|jgi:queuine tRNA-ribosyltransferase|nr:tRNA guanosine(34) transglycosylase Tgt [bacterium]
MELSGIFQVEGTCGRARAGRLALPHGDVPTPVFMPVGTRASVKTLDSRDLQELEVRMLLGNSYHLYLRPGTEILRRAGGLHRFMRWPGPILTDSGGFQVYSLGELRKLKEEGVEFRSHLDGSRHLFTPESVVEIQRDLGSDIMMQLDECPPGQCSEEYAARSLELSARWAGRARRAWLGGAPRHGFPQALFPIVQGGVHEDLRRRSMELLLQDPWPGIAIGGLSVGEAKTDMRRVTDLCGRLLPAELPRYLMGVGTPEDILESIALGVDMFDCVLPTRNARKGTLFTTQGRFAARSARHREAFDQPLDPDCDCLTCRTYDRAHLRHLFHVEEFSAMRLGTLHNLRYFLRLVEGARQAILAGGYPAYVERCLAPYRGAGADEENARIQ